MNFEKIDVRTLENATKAIGDDWMLITVKDEKNNRINAMTASWGALGYLWRRPVCICFVRPERHTFGLLDEQKEFSIAFLAESDREAYNICGRESGAELDKLQKCGLSTSEIDGIPIVSEAQTVLTCKVLYEDDIKENGFLETSILSNYANAGYHRMYICEILGAYEKNEK